MPIYEYECGACGRVHEVIQKMSDNPLTDCPECSGRLHKRISQCTFHLKGGGWYVTDYANSSGKSSTPEIKNKPSKTESTETSCSDATSCAASCKSADSPST